MSGAPPLLPQLMDHPEGDDADDGPFWQGLRERRLLFQRCASCGQPRHPPSPTCGVCGSPAGEWTEAPRRGRVFSFTVARVAAHPALREHVPYNIVVVEFPELPGVRLVSNVIDAVEGDLGIGSTVELVWHQLGEHCLPKYRLVE